MSEIPIETSAEAYFRLIEDCRSEVEKLQERLAQYERHAILRDEQMPGSAKQWWKWHDGSTEWRTETGLIGKPAPDLWPDQEGPITLVILG